MPPTSQDGAGGQVELTRRQLQCACSAVLCSIHAAIRHLHLSRADSGTSTRTNNVDLIRNTLEDPRGRDPNHIHRPDRNGTPAQKWPGMLRRRRPVPGGAESLHLCGTTPRTVVSPTSSPIRRTSISVVQLRSSRVGTLPVELLDLLFLTSPGEKGAKAATFEPFPGFRPNSPAMTSYAALIPWNDLAT